jgi:hypothetical protein
MLARGLGARDLLLGIGALTSSGQDARRWLAAGLAADATDLLITLRQREQLPRTGRVLVMATAGAGVGLGAVAVAPPR